MFSCETFIVIVVVLIVFTAGIGAVLGCVRQVIRYDTKETAIYHERDVTNGEVMRVAQVLFDYLE
ncbi:MAG: hypothetical protein E7385_06065 [Ruminococcaceae bacterium]|nr:hypothetical protein [Oscillospiraceae bacterium]